MDDDRKRHLKGIPPLDGGYTAMAPASLWMLRGQVQAALGCGIAFRPIIPSAFAIGACLRYFRGLGRIAAPTQLEAAAFSFLATCLITLTWTFSQNAGLPAL